MGKKSSKRPVKVKGGGQGFTRPKIPPHTTIVKFHTRRQSMHFTGQTGPGVGLRPRLGAAWRRIDDATGAWHDTNDA